MSEFSSPGQAVLPTHISTFSRWCVPFSSIRATSASATTTASGTLTAANTAQYYPFILPWAFPVARAFWVNGSAVASNVEVGIYSAGFSKIYSTGAVAQSGASVAQYVDATDFWLAPGAYHMVITCSGTTNALWGFTSATLGTQMRSLGVFQSAHGPGSLPAIVTPVQNAQGGFWVFGFTRMASGF